MRLPLRFLPLAIAVLLAACTADAALPIQRTSSTTSASRGEAADTMTATPGRYRHTLAHDGLARQVIVQVPEGYRPGQPTPLVLALHGAGDSGDSFARQRADLLAEANRLGWLIAFPSGTPCLQGNGGCWASRDDPPSIAMAEADDVGFLRALIGNLRDRLDADAARLYVTGFSNGANMAQRLAAEAPDLVAAAAPVAGFVGRTMHRTDYDYSMVPTPQGPVPILIVKGLQDDVVVYHGGVRPGGTFQVLAAEYDANWWAEANGCDIGQVEETGTTGIADRLDGPFATHDYRVGCRDGATVRLVSVAAMDHTWPTDRHGFDASRAVFAFFSRH